MKARLAAVLAGLLALGGCTIHSRVRSAVAATAGEPRSVCVLFFDGLSHHALQNLVEAGALPTIKREILDRALVFDTAVASVPSETYPNLAAMLTGLLPGHHGIPANIWLDRRLRRRESHTNIFRNFSVSQFLEPQAKTLYERLPHDTVAITTPIARGVTVHSRNLVAVMASYSRNDWPFLDRKTLDDVGDAYAGAAASGKLPSLVWGHLLGPDEVAHFDGPDSPEFRNTLESIDRAFARLERRLKRRGIYDRILFVLIGDHGNANYANYVDPTELVHRALFSHPTEADCSKGRCHPVSARRANGHYEVGDAEVAVGAYRGVMVWLPADRPPEDVPAALRTRKKKRRHAPAPPLPAPAPRSGFAAALAHRPEIQLVVTRGSESGGVELYGPAGESRITRDDSHEHGARYAYHLVEGLDPLGYAEVPDLTTVFDEYLAADRWLQLTADTEYPDAVVQLSEFFDSTRAPDVFITPRAGYGFTSGKAAGHGSMSRLETVVPLVFAGPGVTPGHRRVARTVDLAPTLLRYLGVAFDPNEMDGDDLAIAPSLSPAAPIVPAEVEDDDE